MTNLARFWCGILVVGTCTLMVQGERQGRLVLEGELDVYQEVVQLKEEVARLKALIEVLFSQHFKKPVPSFPPRAVLRDYLEADSHVTFVMAVINPLKGGNCEEFGSTYVRWGRTTCPGNGATATYSGFMAGTSFSGSGTAADYQCLPSVPTWDYYEDDLQDTILITGVQYEFTPHFGENATKFFGADIRNAEAPCAVCHTTRSATIMVPGRKDCHTGWTKEYSGYLVGGYPGYNDASNYVCLDRRPEMVPHSGRRDNENMLYFVEGHCGKNLACPPYVHGRELACVVCSI